MHPRDSHAGRPDPHGCGSFSSFIEDNLVHSNRSPATTRNQRTALNHFARALGHETPAPLALTDLTSANCSAALADLVAAGMTPANANRQRQVWLTIAKAAKSAGLLSTVPKVPALPQTSRVAVEPWPLGEVERIFASARALTGTLAEIPADRWWSALLSVLCDTALSVADLLAVPKIDYDRRTGTLCSGLLSYQLHPRAVAALDAIRFHPQERLIPWPFDDGKAPFHTLLADLRLDVVVAIREQPLSESASVLKQLLSAVENGREPGVTAEWTGARSPSKSCGTRRNAGSCLKIAGFKQSRLPRRPNLCGKDAEQVAAARNVN